MPRKKHAAYEECLPPGDGVEQALKNALDDGAPDPSNMSTEERCVYVLKRGTKNNNHQYMCKGCAKVFTGTRQKIRIHITGITESSTYITKCPRPFSEHFNFCLGEQRKKLGDAAVSCLPVSSTQALQGLKEPCTDGDGASSAAASCRARTRHPCPRATAPSVLRTLGTATARRRASRASRP